MSKCLAECLTVLFSSEVFVEENILGSTLSLHLEVTAALEKLLKDYLAKFCLYLSKPSELKENSNSLYVQESGLKHLLEITSHPKCSYQCPPPIVNTG